MIMEHDDPMEFLIAGFLVRDRMSPKEVTLWHAALRREVDRRGGLVSDNYVDKSIARDVLAEIAERAIRRFATEITPRLHKHMDDAAVERFETELSNVLLKTLDYLAVKF